MATRKTIFHMEVTNNTWSAKYTGNFELSDDKAVRKHDERLMDALIADDRILNFWYRIVMPVVRFKRRQARKQLKQQKTGLDA